jgi:hypothetical protein
MFKPSGKEHLLELEHGGSNNKNTSGIGNNTRQTLRSINGMSDFVEVDINGTMNDSEPSINRSNNTSFNRPLRLNRKSEGVQSTNTLNRSEVSSDICELGVITNESELANKLNDKFFELTEKSPRLSNSALEQMAATKINRFKNSMLKRLLGMGVDRYEEKRARAGGFIKKIVKDYFENTKEVLGFGLVVEHDKDGTAKDVVLSADKFIDSVDLNKVVVRIRTDSKDRIQTDNIYLDEYVTVVGVGAVETMEKLKKMRTKLTPDVSRWFGAVQRMIGGPKEGEPFRSYLQRAMSMKSEVDGNLNNPEKENIENALREVVPMLYDVIKRERATSKAKNLNEVVASIRNDESTKETEKIDLSEYLEVVEMDAERALNKLGKLGLSLDFNVRNWLKTVQSIVGNPKEGESLRDYLQRAIEQESEINKNLFSDKQENIKKVLKVIIPVLHKVVLFDRLGE